MADHIRAQIRDAIVAVLDAYSTPAWNAVHPSRRHVFQTEELPALAVYATTETSEPENIGATRHIARIAEVVIEGVVIDNDMLDETLDALARDVETAMGTAVMNRSSDLRGLVRDAVLVRTEIGLQSAKNSEQKTGHVAMTYRVNYRTRLDDPTTIN